MINIIKNNLFYIIIFFLLIYKSTFINLFSNINQLFTNNSNKLIIENKILNNEIKKLENDLEEVTKLKEINNNYKLTRLSYRLSYSDNNFYIIGNNYNENDYLINEYGLVGMITKINNKYSEAIFLKGIKNISAKINNSYGSITEFVNGYFVIDDLSNYDQISINDKALTINDLLIGYVYKIEELNYKKRVYIKSNVDFNNINYLYVVN